MAQLAGRGHAFDRPFRYLGFGELGRDVLELRLGHFAAADQPAPGLCQRDAHQPAAAFGRSALQRYERAERHQIAGQIIDRRHRIELRAGLFAGEELTLASSDAADVLHDRVETAPARPRADMAERA